MKISTVFFVATNDHFTIVIEKNHYFQAYLYACSINFMSKDLSSRCYTLLLVLLGYVLPLVVIVRSYTKIVVFFKRSNQEIENLVNSDIVDLLIQVGDCPTSNL